MSGANIFSMNCDKKLVARLFEIKYLILDVTLQSLPVPNVIEQFVP